MNIRKFAKRFVFQSPEGDAGVGGAMDQGQAASAFESLLSGAAAEPSGEEENPEATHEGEDNAATEGADADEGDEESEGEAAPEPSATVEFEVDGKKVSMTKEQIAEAVKGQMRQDDYTKKTMQAAEERKTANAEREAARAEREQYAQKLNNFVIAQDSIFQQEASALTEELLNSDPVAYLTLQRTLQLRQAEMQKAQVELQQLEQQRQQEHAEAMKSYQAEQLEKLLAKLPEWKDPKKAKAEVDEITGYMASQEFTPQEISGMSDHRVLLLSRKAMLYDKLMSKAAEATKKVAKAPAMVERPGKGEPANVDGRTRAMKQLAKSGSVHDAAAAFASFL